MNAKQELSNIDEAALRVKCIEYLRYNTPEIFQKEDYILINELVFEDGKRRADLVLLGHTFDVYELKSDLDNLDKLAGQIEDYKKTFDRITVVTTQKHISSVRNICPEQVGILLVTADETKLVRKAKPYKRFDRFSLASILKSPTLNSLCMDLDAPLRSKMSVTDKRFYISHRMDTQSLKDLVKKELFHQFQASHLRFIEYIGEHILADDLLLLSKLEQTIPLAPIHN